MRFVNTQVDPKQIADFCRRWKVTELALFGSALREDFRDASDVDVLVTFAEGSRASFADLDAMESELTALFGRRVDLVERALVEQSENYIRRREILASAERL